MVKNKNKLFSFRGFRLAVAVALVGLLTIVFIDMIFIGNAAYVMKWAECGVRPSLFTQASFDDYVEPAVIREKPSFWDVKYTTPISDLFIKRVVTCSITEAEQYIIKGSEVVYVK